ncbi:MAG: hypothetical protein RQ990_05455 [Candidatus Hydrothermia bacterium]|jgi:hypothetical protein|nr:hypothetical protein [Candidatus Hydrothermia bacterium]
MIMTDKVLEIAQLGLSITDKCNSENIVIRKGRKEGKAIFDIISSLNINSFKYILVSTNQKKLMILK